MDDPTDQQTPAALSLDRYVASVWRAKWLIILVTLIAAAVAWFVASRQPVTHTAVALIEVGRVWKEPIEDPYVTKEITNGSSFIQTVADKSGVRANILKRSIRVDTVEGGPRRERYPIFVRITATTESADESVKLAQAVADEAISRHEKLFSEAMAPHLDRQRRIETRIQEMSAAANRELVIRLESELDEVKANNSSLAVTRKTALIERATPTGAIQPEVSRRVAAAGLLAAIISIAIAALVGGRQWSVVGQWSVSRGSGQWPVNSGQWKMILDPDF